MLSILLSVCGLAFGIQNLRSTYKKFGFSCQSIQIVAWFFTFVVYFGIFYLKLNLVFTFFLIIILNSLPQISIRIANRVLINKHRDQIIPFLEQLILSVHTGMTFRSAFLTATKQMDDLNKKQFLNIYSVIVMPSDKVSLHHKYFDEFAAELAKIDRSQAKCIEQLKYLQRQYKIELGFRRRSGQVMQQIRMQALIAGCLYAALFVFTISQFGFFAHWRLLTSSMILFLTGELWIFLGGRRLSWKV